MDIMMKRITITSGDIILEAELNDSLTSQAIWSALPITGSASVWGDEVYFEIPVEMPQEPGARQDMEVGELGYWPVGRAFCIFFGPTPVSTSGKPRAYSPVNVLGKVLGDAREFKTIRSGEDVTISK
jgi:hypothetical protein